MVSLLSVSSSKSDIYVPVKHPVERVVAAVADVNGDAAKLGVKHSVPGVALHVVGGLVEIPHPGDVVFPCNS